MTFKFRVFVMIMCLLITISGCDQDKVNLSKNITQTIKDYSHLKPYVYDIEDDEFSYERNIQMGNQYEGLKVFGGLRRFNYYRKPILKENLSDYIISISEDGLYNSIISLFYDTRTITLDKHDLIELFELWHPEVYVSVFERNFDNGLNIRVYNILEDPLVPTKSSIKIIQTWDDEKIYCQLVDTYLPRRFTDVISLTQPGKSNRLLIWCYNLGVRGQYLSTELQYWEFKDNRWLPCELEIDIQPGFELEEYFIGDEKRSNLARAVYSDGIAFYNSIFGENIYLYENIEVIKENEVFRVSSKEYPDYYVDLTIVD